MGQKIGWRTAKANASGVVAISQAPCKELSREKSGVTFGYVGVPLSPQYLGGTVKRIKSSRIASASQGVGGQPWLCETPSQKQLSKEMVRWAEYLLKYKDLSLEAEHPHKEKQSLTVYIHTVLEAWSSDEPQGLSPVRSAKAVDSRLSEGPCVKQQ